MYGTPLDQAEAAMLMIHGRGASAEDILYLAEELAVVSFAYLAPQAAGYSWYPQRFIAPLEANQPWLDSAIKLINQIVGEIQAAGIPAEKTIILGFSQGACLALEYSTRYAHRSGGIVALSGGLIGPHIEAAHYAGSLAGTPVFMGCSDVDPHIPKQRVLETAQIMRQLEAQVDMRLYPGMGHTVNQDELDAVRNMMRVPAK
jgi:phospholipase/carboxylesterase